jgi:hypothetical protein
MRSFKYKKETFYDGDIIEVCKYKHTARGELFITSTSSVTRLYLLSNDSKFNGGNHAHLVETAKKAKGYKYSWWLMHSTSNRIDFNTITKINTNIDNYEII